MGQVLIVDDHEPTCRALANVVRAAGHDAEFVLGGREALARVHESSALPDLIVLDYMMPGIDGLDVLREIRRDARTADVPVVMFSAVADASIQSYAKAQGANDYWIKATITLEMIHSRLAEMISTPPAA